MMMMMMILKNNVFSCSKQNKKQLMNDYERLTDERFVEMIKKKLNEYDQAIVAAVVVVVFSEPTTTTKTKEINNTHKIEK